ncbi:MAG: hypothetical protein P4L73_01110 [Caulobacteraceae bacterium]|nr:hypothetical protein [Caulobacteraceae bacterium]
MIHHFSIAARDPVLVAAVLAELMGGRDYPFSGPLAGARMAVSGEPNGAMIEVYPETITLKPGEADGPVVFSPGEADARFTPFHALLSVPLDRQAIERIGERVGWRTRFFNRGRPGQPPVFSVIEVWIENRIMLEIVPADMVAPYKRHMQFETLDALGL